MMTAREMLFAVVISAVAASLLMDIVGFVSHTLPNFLRRAKIKKGPVNPDAAVMAMVLKDMRLLGLTELKPDKEISLVPEVQVSELPRLNAEKESVRVRSHE
jgi:hypothetical protein